VHSGWWTAVRVPAEVGDSEIEIRPVYAAVNLKDLAAQGLAKTAARFGAAFLGRGKELLRPA
jgi:hypothetical protein